METVRPLTDPMCITLVRMASVEWIGVMETTGIGFWHPRGQERLILQALMNRGLIDRSEAGVFLTATGASIAGDLVRRGWTVDGAPDA
jgi:hypothetical protein